MAYSLPVIFYGDTTNLAQARADGYFIRKKPDSLVLTSGKIRYHTVEFNVIFLLRSR
jgi:hypothetical protein